MKRMSEAAEKLQDLRSHLAAAGLSGFLVPRADAYQGEFVAPADERLRWLTGFSGSAGAAVVLMDQAVVLTDGRYTLQVKQQIDSAHFSAADITKTGIGAWLAEHAKAGQVIGYDPWLHTPEQIAKIEKAIEGRGFTLKALHENPLDAAWADRPVITTKPVEIFPAAIAGHTHGEKIKIIAQNVQRQKALACILSLPDSISWLLNLRGDDVECVPAILSYAVVYGQGRVQWIVDPQKIMPEIKTHLGDAVEIVPPAKIHEIITMLAAGAKAAAEPIMLDEARSPIWFKNAVAMAGAETLNQKDPCIEPKALKTSAEQQALCKAHEIDGAALVKFLHWLDEHNGNSDLDEVLIDTKLQEFRGQHPAYRGPSFATIAGFADHGAIVHYRATPETAAVIKPPGLLLIDSGGQYGAGDIYGTTDITRTLAIGTPSEAMRQHFTLVLKGHIALASAKFAPGTTGREIDALARTPLQNAGLDYAHGTGHGVGCYLAVHEEAASLSPKGKDAVQAGMLLSNEPGYYEEGAYGIRIESLVLAVKDGESLGFETVSLVPIDRTLIIKDLLSPEEIVWLNAYHQRVYQTLAPLLDKEVADWLKQQTAPL